MAKQRTINIIYKVNADQLDKLKLLLEQAKKETGAFEDKIKHTSGAADELFNRLKKAFATTAIISGIGLLTKKIFELGVAQEQINVSFTTFLKSADLAKKVIADLNKFSTVTPFTPDQVFRAARTLLSFGVEANKLIPTLKFLGDVSAGTGKDLAELGVIFGQIRSTGRLMGQDLLQLINAGFNPLQEMSRTTGKSVLELKQDMEKGLITFDDVENAFKSATSAGGLFFNLMEKQSQTVGGKLSTLKGNIEELEKQIFEASSGPIAKFVDQLLKISRAATVIDLAFKHPISSLAGFDIALKSLTEGELKRFLEVAEINGTPWQKFTESFDKVDIKTLSDNLGKYRQQFFLTFQQEGQSIDDIRILWKFYLNERLSAAEDENAKEKADREKAVMDEVEAAKKRLEIAKDDAAKRKKISDDLLAQIKMGIKENDPTEELYSADDIEHILGRGGELFDGLDALTKKWVDEQNKQYDQDFQNYVDKTNKELQAEEDASERKKELNKATTDFAISALHDLFLAASTLRQEDESNIDDYYNKQIELAGNNTAVKEKLEKEQAEAHKQYQDKQKEIDRKNTIRQIEFDTAANIIKSILENGGIPAGIPFGLIAAAYGAVQLATVRKLAGGEIDIKGPGSATSDSIPAMLSRGESVMTAEETMRSKGILKDIKAKKLDDRIIDRISKGQVGRDMPEWTDERIVQAINRNKAPDLVEQGSMIFARISKNRDHVKKVRKRWIH